MYSSRNLGDKTKQKAGSLKLGSVPPFYPSKESV